MEVRCYDGRTDTWRTRDVPLPLCDELVISHWDPTGRVRYDKQGYRVADRSGVWQDEVYQRTGPVCYAFIGTVPGRRAPSGPNAGVPRLATIPWPGTVTR